MPIKRGDILGRFEHAASRAVAGFLRGLPILFLLIGVLPTEAGADSYRLGGSGSTLATVRTLADAFARREPGFSLTVSTNMGSSGAIRALSAGAIDIATVSRPLRPQESAGGLTWKVIGRSPFVLATSHALPQNLTAQQLADIYAGRQTAWPDGTPIRLVLRPRDDSDTEMLRSVANSLPPALEVAYARSGMTIAITDQEAADMLQRLPGSLGTATLSTLVSEKRTLRPLALEGIAPVHLGRPNPNYRYFKPMAIVLPRQVPAQLQRFLEFLGSAEARLILDREGYIAVRGGA